MELTHEYWIRPGAAVLWMPRFLDATRERDLRLELERSLNWHQGSITLFGRAIAEPRLTAWCGDHPYTYSRRTLPARPWSLPLAALKDQLNEVLQSLGVAGSRPLNHVLLNRYRDGQDAMGWHRDNEPELGAEPLICSLSLGCARRFVMRPRARDARHLSMQWSLGCGDVLVMYGASQVHWEHSLRPTNTAVGSRINLTFRAVGDC